MEEEMLLSKQMASVWSLWQRERCDALYIKKKLLWYVSNSKQGWVGFLSNVKNHLEMAVKTLQTKGLTSNSNNMELFQISIRRRNICVSI